MATYRELFLQEYQDVYENCDIATEGTPLFKGTAAMFSQDAQDCNKYSKSGKKFENKKEYKKALEEYKKAKQSLSKVMSSINKIEDEDALSWIVRLCVMPWWVSVGQIVSSDFSWKSVTRTSTKKMFKKTEESIDDSIKRVQQLMKESK